MKFVPIKVENGNTIFKLVKDYEGIRYEPKINYFLNIGNCFNTGIEENLDRLIIDKNEEKTYTEADLQKEYSSATVYSFKDWYFDDTPKQVNVYASFRKG